MFKICNSEFKPGMLHNKKKLTFLFNFVLKTGKLNYIVNFKLLSLHWNVMINISSHFHPLLRIPKICLGLAFDIFETKK